MIDACVLLFQSVSQELGRLMWLQTCWCFKWNQHLIICFPLHISRNVRPCVLSCSLVRRVPLWCYALERHRYVAACWFCAVLPCLFPASDKNDTASGANMWLKVMGVRWWVCDLPACFGPWVLYLDALCFSRLPSKPPLQGANVAGVVGLSACIWGDGVLFAVWSCSVQLCFVPALRCKAGSSLHVFDKSLDQVYKRIACHVHCHLTSKGLLAASVFSLSSLYNAQWNKMKAF